MSSTTTIKVVTFNSLNEAYIRNVQNYTPDHYPRLSKGAVIRTKLAIGFLGEMSADICAIQELSRTAFIQMQADPLLGSQYIFHYQSHFNRPIDGVAIFTKKRFALINKQTDNTGGVINKTQLSLDLKDNDTDKIIRVTTCHLFGDPNLPTVTTTHLDQVIAFAERPPFRSDAQPHLNILLGDMNFTSTSPFFGAVVRSGYRTDGSDYNTDTAANPPKRIDYIFEKQPPSASHFLSKRVTPPGSTSTGLSLYENYMGASDHLPGVTMFIYFPTPIDLSVATRSETGMDGETYQKYLLTTSTAPPALTFVTPALAPVTTISLSPQFDAEPYLLAFQSQWNKEGLPFDDFFRKAYNSFKEALYIYGPIARSFDAFKLEIQFRFIADMYPSDSERNLREDKWYHFLNTVLLIGKMNADEESNPSPPPPSLSSSSSLSTLPTPLPASSASLIGGYNKNHPKIKKISYPQSKTIFGLYTVPHLESEDNFIKVLNLLIQALEEPLKRPVRGQSYSDSVRYYFDLYLTNNYESFGTKARDQRLRDALEAALRAYESSQKVEASSSLSSSSSTPPPAKTYNRDKIKRPKDPYAQAIFDLYEDPKVASGSDFNSILSVLVNALNSIPISGQSYEETVKFRFNLFLANTYEGSRKLPRNQGLRDALDTAFREYEKRQKLASSGTASSSSTSTTTPPTPKSFALSASDLLKHNKDVRAADLASYSSEARRIFESYDLSHFPPENHEKILDSLYSALRNPLREPEHFSSQGSNYASRVLNLFIKYLNNNNIGNAPGKENYIPNLNKALNPSDPGSVPPSLSSVPSSPVSPPSLSSTPSSHPGSLSSMPSSLPVGASPSHSSHAPAKAASSTTLTPTPSSLSSSSPPGGPQPSTHPSPIPPGASSTTPTPTPSSLSSSSPPGGPLPSTHPSPVPPAASSTPTPTPSSLSSPSSHGSPPSHTPVTAPPSTPASSPPITISPSATITPSPIPHPSPSLSTPLISPPSPSVISPTTPVSKKATLSKQLKDPIAKALFDNFTPPPNYPSHLDDELYTHLYTALTLDLPVSGLKLPIDYQYQDNVSNHFSGLINKANPKLKEIRLQLGQSLQIAFSKVNPPPSSTETVTTTTQPVPKKTAHKKSSKDKIAVAIAVIFGISSGLTFCFGVTSEVGLVLGIGSVLSLIYSFHVYRQNKKAKKNPMHAALHGPNAA